MGFNSEKEVVQVNSQNQLSESKVIIGTDIAKAFTITIKDGTYNKQIGFGFESNKGARAFSNIDISAEDRPASQKTGNYEFIDQYGNTTWAKSISEISKTRIVKDYKTNEDKEIENNIDFTTVRRAKVGESDVSKIFREIFKKNSKIGDRKTTYKKLSDFQNASDFVKLVNGDENLLKETIEGIKTMGTPVFVNFTVYKSNQGEWKNKALPVVLNAETSTIVTHNQDVQKFISFKGEKFKDLYKISPAIEFEPPVSVSKAVEDIDSLPF